MKLANAGESDRLPDDSFGNYEILCEIGQGGMGVVYLAEQRHLLHREVALKVLKPGLDNEAILARFETERQVLALMKHPNIATFHDAGSSSWGRPYFVMEFVDGLPITEACDRRSSSINERLELFMELCGAIDHAHRAGVVHRDIKPSNVLVGLRDGRPTPKVIDFGIARALSGHLTGRTVATSFGELLGTPEYMSPEQAAFDSENIGPASDIYSLGVLLYELIAGVLPFEPAQLREAGIVEATRVIREVEAPSPAMRFVQSDRPLEIAACRQVSLDGLKRLLAHDLARVMETCLRKDPQSRYGSAKALADDVSRYIRGEPVVAQRPTAAYRARKWLYRYRGTAASVAIALAVALPAIWLSRRVQRPAAPPNIVPLTSYTGTEFEPSLSPDGSRIAFVWDGGTGNFDIYVKPVQGGNPVRLTTNPDLDLFPAWSPDARNIAFVRISPEGKSLCVVAADGTRERNVALLHSKTLLLAADAALNSRPPGPAWSSDNQSIVLADSDEQSKPDALYEYLANGEARRRLTAPEPGSSGDFAPAFSPDHNSLAFVRNQSSRGNSAIYLLNLRSRKLQQLLTQDRGISGLQWMSNTDLLFSSNRSGPNILWRASTRDGVASPIVGAGRGMNNISYSSQTGRVVYAEQASNKNVWRIRLNQGKGLGVAQKLLFSSRRTDSAEFAPNGTAIVFVSDRLGTRQIWLTKAPAATPVQLSAVASEVPIGTPRWSPDGLQIVYDTVKDGHSAIGIMNADGSAAHIFASDPWDDMMPSWSHDGRRIYFTCKINGIEQVCYKLIAGGASTPITKKGAGEARESPDAKFLFYSKENGIWKVTLNGDLETPVDGLNEAGAGRYWTVGKDAIYFLRSMRKPWIVYRYDLTDRSTSRVMEMESPPDFGSPGLSVSPDGTDLLFGQIDGQSSNIIMVDGIYP